MKDYDTGGVDSMKKTMLSILLAGTLALCLTSCGRWKKTASDSVAATEAPVVTAATDSQSTVTDTTESAQAATATPEPTASLRAGTYQGEDGSVLTVKEDGTCTYKTELSGTINGQAMTGTVTFHGTVENGVFTFTKITYMGMDITSMATSAGYSDATYWEEAAASLYG